MQDPGTVIISGMAAARPAEGATRRRIFTRHADSHGELAYALDYASAQSETVHVSEDA
ncbi:MAG TPA: hypothetical protein VFB71_02800 [Ramlibacter sp.]|nr:hypothetical protein [Ramlibacter sp.]